ncbi:hypothetical protein ACPOL_0676 [Acidisarcina polymorpha]|uniref:Uncharacterized protein n=1 Tax=Acidisarcina polymorpha TaxID=2211140 RepID=A0A2Z5FT92_9BACT|nr:hypothetical protein [Acidisarcina polymorpha]AXC10043.1 hypothetical protein ACPOL_0676 [Acidisarcina polymorpha]
MKQKRIRKNGQPWPNVGRWASTLTAEQRTEHFKSGPRAQWGPEKTSPKKAGDGPWAWPLELDRYDRASPLTIVEEDMLTRYAEAYRFYRYGRTMDFGPSLNRLVQPLNDALDYTGIKTGHRKMYCSSFCARWRNGSGLSGDGLRTSGSIPLNEGAWSGSISWRSRT